MSLFEFPITVIIFYLLNIVLLAGKLDLIIVNKGDELFDVKRKKNWDIAKEHLSQLHILLATPTPVLHVEDQRAPLFCKVNIISQ